MTIDDDDLRHQRIQKAATALYDGTGSHACLIRAAPARR
jgi:hypothetical protein